MNFTVMKLIKIIKFKIPEYRRKMRNCEPDEINQVLFLLSLISFDSSPFNNLPMFLR